MVAAKRQKQNRNHQSINQSIN